MPPRLQDQRALEFGADLLAGLRAHPKRIPSKYLYDEAGARLFDRICETPEYYPTRVELSIMREHAAEMAAACGAGVVLVEFGSGASLKTRLLLDQLDAAAYVPIDISRKHLAASAAGIATDYPQLRVLPLCADFTQAVELPSDVPDTARRVAYFPGSTIGNFTDAGAADFLGRTARLCGPGGGLLIGVDLVKDRGVLERAYNDSAGVTAAFNRNVLSHANAVAGTDFDPDAFAHLAFFDEEKRRIEMHLVAESDQSVQVDGVEIRFTVGESIRTELSHKYELEQFAGLAERGGFDVRRVWTDAKGWFSVQYLSAR